MFQEKLPLIHECIFFERAYIDRTGIKRSEQGKEASVKETDAGPSIKQDRTYVPVRFFAEETGLDVQWDDKTRTVILRNKTMQNEADTTPK